MKKQLRFLMLTLLCAVFSTTWGQTEEVTDDLDRALTGVTGTSYTDWSDKTSNSDAVYAGNSAGGNSSIQLRSSSNSGIITTASGGKVKKIVVEWNSNTTSGRTLNVYGKNTTYSAASDLYNSSKQGTLLGTIVYGTSTELTISGDYAYIGLRSSSGAMYLTKIEITWESEASSTTVATPVFSVPAANYHVAQSVEISCTTSGATIRYTTNGDEPTESSTEYTGAITVDRNMPLKAKAFKDDDASATASAEYTFSPVKPTLSPVGGSYQTQQNVTISCETSGATIKYFLSDEAFDNPTDDQFVNVYNEAIQINETKFLYVKAFKTNWNSSEFVKAKYTILRTPTPLAINSNYFVKVTDVNDLIDGDAILIVNETFSQALSTTQANNRRGTNVTISNSCINDISEDVQKIVLLKEGNYWYFYVENNENDPAAGYLYAASSSSNYLKTEAEQDDNAKAAINFADGNASIIFQGTNTRNVLQFNDNTQQGVSSPIFACYSSASQKPIQIYKEVPLEVTIGSTGYATLYYSDKAFVVPEGVTASTYKTDREGQIVRSKEYKTSGGTGTFIPQGEAVVLKGTPGTYTFVTTTATADPDNFNALHGFDTASQTTAPTNDDYYFYKLSTNTAGEASSVGFWWGATGGAAFEIPAHKAYLAILQSEFPTPTEVTESFVFDETVGINKVQKDALSAEDIYTLSGIRVNSNNLPKGIYIMNGKKIVIK